MPHPSHSSQFYHPNNIWWAVQIIKLLIMWFPLLPRYLVPLTPKYSPQHHILKHPHSLFSSLNVSNQVSHPCRGDRDPLITDYCPAEELILLWHVLAMCWAPDEPRLAIVCGSNFVSLWVGKEVTVRMTDHICVSDIKWQPSGECLLLYAGTKVVFLPLSLFWCLPYVTKVTHSYWSTKLVLNPYVMLGHCE